MQDPVSDMLTRVRNAQAAGHKKTVVPYSSIKKQILNVLKSEGYIENFEVTENGVLRNLQIDLKYYNGRPVIEGIERVSKPSKRVYVSRDKIPVVKGGLGTSVLTTSMGVLSGKAAVERGCGGELLCCVY